MTAGAKPISVEERLARIAKLQRLMVDQKIGALILESGHEPGLLHRRPVASLGAYDRGRDPGPGRRHRRDAGLRGTLDPRDAGGRRRRAALE